jgi:multisubunit Na+/H+ antiporter MnhB subunit
MRTSAGGLSPGGLIALVVVLFLVAAMRTPASDRVRRVSAGWLAASVVVSVVIAIGSPMYRPHRLTEGHDPGGGHVQKIATDHPIYHDLNLHQRLDLEVVGEGGFMPALLRESVGSRQ